MTAFIGWIIVTLLLGFDVLTTSERLIATFYAIRFILMAAIFVLTAVLFPTPNEQQKLFSGWLVAAAGLILLGLAQLVIFPNFAFMARYGWDPHVGRLLSTFFDPNFFGLFLVLTLSFVIARLLLQPQRRSGWAYAILLGGLVALVLTFSRSSYLAFVVSGLVILTVRSWKLVLVVLIALGIVVAVVPRVRTRVAGALKIDVTAQDRLQSWHEALVIIEKRPLVGVGYNAFGPAQLRAGLRHDLQSQASQGNDSSWLLILATTGYIGFLIMGGFMLILLYEALLVYRFSSSAYIRTMGLTLLGVIPAYIVHSQFVNSLFYPLLFAPFGFMVAGVIIGLKTLPA
ncbi:MAG: O-antigen ligase family protein, partial [Patescibacteria group bacterium]